MTVLVPVDIAPPSGFSAVAFRLYLKQKPRLPDVNRLGAFLQLNVLLACSLFLVFGFSRLLLRRSFGGALASSGLCFFVASVIHQFNDGQLGAVAGTPAHLDD